LRGFWGLGAGGVGEAVVEAIRELLENRWARRVRIEERMINFGVWVGRLDWKWKKLGLK
jgi:hypothetical protein